MDVTDEVLNNFKVQVTQHGMESDTIIMSQDQGTKQFTRMFTRSPF